MVIQLLPDPDIQATFKIQLLPESPTNSFKQAFELALAAAGGATPSTTLFFDDSTRNVAAATELGLYTVLVGRKGAGIGASLEVRGTMLSAATLSEQLRKYRG